LGFVHLLKLKKKNTTFQKPAPLPFSGNEPINLVGPLECVTGRRFGSRFCFRLLPDNIQPSGPFISSYSQLVGTAERVSF